MQQLTALALVVAAGAIVATAGLAGTRATAPNAADRNFVQKAGASGAAEIAAANVALTRSHDSQVIAFAHRMIRDHGRMGTQLKQAAKAAELTPPAKPDAAQQASISRLEGLSGSAFDDAYKAQQVKAHVAAVSLFLHEGRLGKFPMLRHLASASLPTLRMHLTMARVLNA
jgi:putative membrane protein